MTVSSKSHQSREQEGRCRGKIEEKLSEVNNRAVFRGQNEFIREFKMVMCGECNAIAVMSFLLMESLRDKKREGIKSKTPIRKYNF